MNATANSCPCDPSRAYNACCGRFVDGWSKPETAEQLMRSRFSAYKLGRIDYVMQTHASETRSGVDRSELSAWAAQTEFQSLQVVQTEAGQGGDETGVVAFVAQLSTNGRPYAMFERSRFIRENGRWMYLDGEQDAAG